MISTVQGNLVIIGLNDVYWKGSLVQGVQYIFLRKGRLINKLVLGIVGGDPAVLAELTAAGIIVKEVLE